MRRIILFLLICSVLSLLPGCRAAENRQEILVGVNLALTGVSAPYGNDALTGIQLAAEQYNASGGIFGRKIKLLIIDNASKSDLAAEAVRRLEKNRVTAILGPSLSHLTRAAAKALTKETCLLTPGATAQSLRPFGAEKVHIIRLCFTDEAQGRVLADKMFSMGIRQAAVVFDPASDYSVSLSAAFTEAFSKQGGNVCEQLSFPERTAEAAPLIHRLKNSGAQALLLPLFYDKGGLFLRQMAEYDCLLPVFSGDGFGNPALSLLAGKKAEEIPVFYTDHTAPEAREIQTGEGKMTLGAYAALGYDTAMTLFEALSLLPERVWSTDEFDDGLLYETLLQTDRVGLTGAYTFSSAGDAFKTPVLITLEKGEPICYQEAA